MLINEIYEEYFINSYPAPHTLNNGGFLLKMGGIDLMTNSVFPLYEKNDKYLAQKLNEIENTLSSYNLPIIYRMIAADEYKTLDRHLLSRNYDKIESGVVLRTMLHGLKEELFRFANFNENGIFIDEIRQDLISDYYYLKDYDNETANTFSNSLNVCPLHKFILTLIEENTLVGQAICVKQDEVVIIRDIVVSKKYRGIGYSQKLLYSILTHAIKINAQIVIADVSSKNEPAIRMFASTNMFESVYETYYRKKIV